MNQLTRITLDPAVMGGKACIRGLRVTVGTIVGLLAAGRLREEILKAYPYLEPEMPGSGFANITSSDLLELNNVVVGVSRPCLSRSCP
jgi:hypothetical protein